MMSITDAIMKALSIPMDEYVRSMCTWYLPWVHLWWVSHTYHEYSYDEYHRYYYEGIKYPNGSVCEVHMYVTNITFDWICHN